MALVCQKQLACVFTVFEKLVATYLYRMCTVFLMYSTCIYIYMYSIITYTHELTHVHEIKCYVLTDVYIYR